MKSTSLIIGGILLVLNLLIGMIISSYETFHVVTNSGIIIVNTALLLVLGTLNVKDGFRYSLNCLFIGMGFVEFILGLFAPERFEDNGFLVFVLFMLLLEVMLLLGSNYISKMIK